MKTMTKRILTWLAAGALAAGMSGCGAPAQDTQTTAAPQGDGSASGAKEVLIGGIGPLTGDYANYGTAARNGAQIAVDEINAAGGVNGMKLVLNYQDSAGDPDSAVAAYGKLIDQGMDVSLGGVLSGENASIVAAAKQDGLLVLTPSASADAAITGNDSAFRVCFTDSSQGAASADYIANNQLATEVAVFYQSDIDYSVGLYRAFEAQCQASNITIKEVQTFTKDTSTDFSTQINAIKDSGAKLVFIPIYAAEASTFLTQAAGKLPEGTVYFGCDGLDGILGKVSDPAVAENVMLLTPFAADDPAENVQAFVKAYKQANGGAAPDQFAADGYDAVYAVKAAMEKAGVTDPAEADFSSKLVAAMTEITVDGVTGTMTWTAEGETVKAAKAMIIHDGAAVLYTK